MRNKNQPSSLCFVKFVIRLQTYLIVCISMTFPFAVLSAEYVDCTKRQPDTVNFYGQNNRLRMCALIGVWDTIFAGSNRPNYSGEVVAWIDDSVSAARATIHNLDLLECANLDRPALVQATLQLVTQISDKNFDKSAVKLLEPEQNKTNVPNAEQQSPCAPVVARNHENNVVAFSAGSREDFQSTICAIDGLKLPDEFVVLAAGAYSGRLTGFQIDQSGHEGTQIDVAVNHKKPVVLMLGAYEPTIWNVGWTNQTQIVAVIVSGYHRQVIAGLKGNVPVLISSYDNRGACGYFYVDAKKLPALNPLSRRLFNQQVDMVYPANNGRALVGESIPAGEELVTATSAVPTSFFDVKTPLAGHAGLEEAVEKGVLRRATPKDSEAWVALVSNSSQQRDEPPIMGMGGSARSQLRLLNAYVVLKPFTYPAGLYGGNMTTFFIPKGVSRPKGKPGHSTIYDFNTMDCEGVLCGR